jgi:hypothetical protein
VKKKLAVVDSSILCVWLRVPGKETCGQWEHDAVDSLIKKMVCDGTGLVLPFPSLIEVGNHIANAASGRYETAQKFSQFIKDAISGTKPWTLFAEQKIMFEGTKLHVLADAFPTAAARGTSLADLAITNIANYYRGIGYAVDILTGDGGMQ